MAANQPSWPRQWLMTDERIGDRLWEAIDRLPFGRGGVVFRHYSLSEEVRLKLGIAIAAATRRRELVLAVAGSARLAEQLGAALHHNPADPADLPISLSVHDEAEAARACELGAELAFVSPVHATRFAPGCLAAWYRPGGCAGAAGWLPGDRTGRNESGEVRRAGTGLSRPVLRICRNRLLANRLDQNLNAVPT